MTKSNRRPRPLFSRRDGFTLVELIVALALLGLLSLLLVPRFALMGDKAMGAAALRDAGTILRLAVSHNAESLHALKQADINRYMNLSAGVGEGAADNGLAGTVPKGGVNGDGSKTVTVNVSGEIRYYYTRGDVTLRALIDPVSQQIYWKIIRGAVTHGDKRYKALCQGLKLSPEGGDGAAALAIGIGDRL